MTPTDILASARSNPLSAVVQACDEWLDGYEGSLRYMGEHGPIAAWRIGGGDDHHHVVFIRGLSVDAVTCGARRLHFDLRIPSVRDWLIRCGAPPIVRDSVPAALAWCHVGGDVEVLDDWMRPLRGDGDLWLRRRSGGDAECFAGAVVDNCLPGWWLQTRTPVVSRREMPQGRESEFAGRDAADMAALGRGWVLDTGYGWYIPLPDGKVGWLPREAA